MSWTTTVEDDRVFSDASSRSVLSCCLIFHRLSTKGTLVAERVTVIERRGGRDMVKGDEEIEVDVDDVLEQIVKVVNKRSSVSYWITL
jgi:hypothetical protein